MKILTALRVPVLALALAAPAFLAPRAAGAEDAPAAAPAGDKIPLAARMEKGAVVWFRQSTKMDQDMDMGGMQMGTQMEMNQTWSQTCDAVDEQGVMSVRTKFARLWGSMTNPMMGEVKFDSDNPDAGSDNPMLGAMSAAMTALAGQEIRSKLSPDGAMTEVAVGDRATDPEQAAQMKEMAQQLEGLTGYPKGPVGVGDTWDVRRTIRMQGMAIAVEVKCKLTAFDTDTATVGMTGTMSMGADDAKGEEAADPRAAAMREMMKKMKITDSAMKGTTRFARKDGLVVASDMEQSMTLEMELPPEAAEQGMTGGMKIAQKVKVKLERTDAPPAKAEKPAETPSEKPPAAPAEKPKEMPAGPGAGEK